VTVDARINVVRSLHETLRSAESPEERMTALFAEVRLRVRSLVDPVEIAASLESNGISDDVAKEHLGARDTFDLADRFAARVRLEGPVIADVVSARPAPERNERWQAVVDYLRGPLALIPIVLLLLIIAGYGEIAKWSTATTLAFSLGMTGSMLVTNCFVQAMSRRGAIYVSREDPRSAGAFIAGVLRVALICIALIAIVTVAAAATLGLFTLGDALVLGAAFTALSVVWLLAGALALVRAPGVLAVSLVAAMAVGFAVDRAAATFYRDHVLAASVAGYATAVATMLIAARRRYGREAPGEPAPALPSLAYLIDEALPYFTYGAQYMALVLLPHVLAWVAVLRTEADRMTAATSFEVALTISLVPIVVTGGLAERSARLFWLTARAALRQTSIVRPQSFADALVRFYATQMLRYLVVLIAISCLAFVLVSTTVAADAVRSIVPSTNASIVQVLIATSLIAYVLLGWGLFNCIFIVGIGRADHATRALKLGIVGTLIGGAPLAFGWHFGFSVLAFSTGALVFALSSFSATQKLLATADYHYYAST
jgi:hypothetical protein